MIEGDLAVFSEEGKEDLNVPMKARNPLLVITSENAVTVNIKDYETGANLGLWYRSSIQKASLKDILAYRKKQNDRGSEATEG